MKQKLHFFKHMHLVGRLTMEFEMYMRGLGSGGESGDQGVGSGRG